MKNKYNFIFNKLDSERGQTLLITVIFFLVVSLLLIFSFVVPVTRSAQITRDLVRSKTSFFLAEAGVEDVIWRQKSSKLTSSPTTITLDGHTAQITIVDVGVDEKKITSTADVDSRIRKVEATLKLDTVSSDFNFGVQTDQGGFIMENNSSVTGNLYSNGSVQGFNNNNISGDVVSAGPSGLIDGINASGVARAHTIQDNTIGGDAYYQIDGGGNTITGTSYPGSTDQPISALPISDTQIDEWKAKALLGGIHTTPCPYVINSGSVSLGPKKIACDLVIENDPTVTIDDWVWVEGNITVSNTAIVQLSPSLGALSAGLIADNESDRLNSSKVVLENNTTYLNSGTNGSYIIILSQNNSAENAGSVVAINPKNSIVGDLLIYAGHGEILLENSGDLRQLTGYRIRLKNFANVTYETGLSSITFTSGPSGGWSVTDWEETQ